MCVQILKTQNENEDGAQQTEAERIAVLKQRRVSFRRTTELQCVA